MNDKLEKSPRHIFTRLSLQLTSSLVGTFPGEVSFLMTVAALVAPAPVALTEPRSARIAESARTASRTEPAG